MLPGRIAAIREAIARFADDRGEARISERYIVAGETGLVHHTLMPSSQLLQATTRTPGFVDLPIRADSILIQSNVRVFGYGGDRRLSVKITCGNPAAARNLRRDLRARAVLAGRLAAAGIRTPRIVAFDRRAAGWYVEEQIHGRRAGEADFVRFLERHGTALYSATARERAPYESRQIAAARAAFAGLAGARRRESARFEELIAGGTWAVALGHGDLDPTNLLVLADGSFCLLDWERALVASVASDLALAYGRFAGARTAVRAVLESLRVEGSLPARRQIAIALAASLAQLEAHPQGDLADRIVDEPLSRSRKRVRDTRRALRLLVTELL